MKSMDLVLQGSFQSSQIPYRDHYLPGWMLSWDLDSS